MTSTFITILLWAAALSSGVMAGVCFSFSAFIMRAFNKIDVTSSIIAMNSINQTILRSLFMPLFFCSSIITLLLIVASIFHYSEAGSELMLIAGSIYFLGMFICTVLCNVPLNNMLKKIDPYSANAQQYWAHYLKTWTYWNHLRTVSSLVTCVLCIWLLQRH